MFILNELCVLCEHEKERLMIRNGSEGITVLAFSNSFFERLTIRTNTNGSEGITVLAFSNSFFDLFKKSWCQLLGVKL